MKTAGDINHNSYVNLSMIVIMVMAKWSTAPYHGSGFIKRCRSFSTVTGTGAKSHNKFLWFWKYTWYMYVGICNWNSMQLKRQKYLTHHQIIITKWKIKSEAGATWVSEINFYPYVWPSSAVKFIFLLQQVAHLSVWTKRVLYRNELLIRARNVYYLVD